MGRLIGLKCLNQKTQRRLGLIVYTGSYQKPSLQHVGTSIYMSLTPRYIGFGLLMQPLLFASLSVWFPQSLSVHCERILPGIIVSRTLHWKILVEMALWKMECKRIQAGNWFMATSSDHQVFPFLSVY